MVDLQVRVAGLDQAALARPLARALGAERGALDVVDWHAAPFGDSLGNATGGVYRVAGSARRAGALVPWSMVLKIVRRPAADVARFTGTGAAPPAFDDWKREVMAYQSGLLESFSGGLTAPRCLDVDDRRTEGVWLWLEDVPDAYGEAWPLARYGLAAQHLGGFNGAYLVAQPVPSYEWLSRGWLRAWCGRWSPRVMPLVDNSATWTHPLVLQAFPVPPVDRIRRLWRESATLLAALERMPQTLCHLDANRTNLIARRRPGAPEVTVAIDWAFAGTAAAGEEIGQLVASSLVRQKVAARDAAALSDVVFAGYVDGLRLAGWHGDERDERGVRFAFTAHAALRWVIPSLLWLGAAFDEGERRRFERIFGRPLEEVTEHLGAVTRFLLDLADEARTLHAALAPFGSGAAAR